MKGSPMPEFPYKVIRKRGESDVRSLAAYRKADGYQALEKVLSSQTPDQVTQQVLSARLRGRGGSGKLTGEKWRVVQQQDDATRYVICNAYDADPRSWAARSLLERNPHQVVEGIILAAFAVGAQEAYLFTRSLYEEGISTLHQALAEAVEANLLGRDILGTDFSLNINVVGVDLGFIGGEETVQMAVIKGRRGMPEQRPPFPAVFGLWEHPTLINSVETLANVPVILREGSGAYASIGSSISGGTKILTVYDCVPDSEPRVIEVPFGTTLREILRHAGYVRGEGELRAIVVGGAEGGALPPSSLDTPFDFDPIEQAGAIVGSGVIELLPASTCMVGWAMDRSRYLSNESCGKCVPCRLGMKRITGVLEGVVSDLGVKKDLDLLDELGAYVPNGSLCGFGVQATNALKTARRYWPEHFQSHIEEQTCPTEACIPSRSHRFNTRYVLP
jgi:NADH-quinone oxidoreductase subunit F